ncbi:MAG: thiamine phosphate synthase [Pseudomonadota bacterium]
MSDERARLYLLTPPEIPDLDGFAHALEEALGGGDVACLQLRLKSADGVSASDAAILAASARLGPIAQNAGAAFLLNDRPDLAAAAAADGVHIGQSDTPYDEARESLGADAIIGVTCHASRHLAMEAGEAGADYVAFGAFFPTDTKLTEHTAAPDLLSWWSEIFTVPCVAIGGVTPGNCGALVAAGADFIAASSAVWGHADGPGAAVRAFNAAIDSAAR